MPDELSGRELSLAVAEQIFGCRWFHCTSAHGPERNQLLSPEQAETWRALDWELTEIEGPQDDQFNDDTGPPHYSKSLEAAFQVVEKVRERHCCVSIMNQFAKGPQWLASFETADGQDIREASACDDSLPTAISRAALACLNGSKE